MSKPGQDDLKPKPDTLLAHGGTEPEAATGSVVPPIHMATTFCRQPGSNRSVSGQSYIRDDNPTLPQPEALLAHLEQGAAGLLFASGMAACTAPFMALKPGDHIVAQTVMYWGLRKWLCGYGREWGLRVDLVPPGDLAALRAAVKPGETKLVWIETPTNPTWEISDIAISAQIAHGAGARLAVDSTTATPILTQPLALGADLVIHSATKYLNGHSDVIAGAVIAATEDDYWTRIRSIRQDLGAMPGSLEAWLLLRGMRTLHLRVARACENAMHIARHFHGHPQIDQVLYPGLPSHPQHSLAARQMHGGFGGMLSIRLRAGREAAQATATMTRWFRNATSLGGVESLIEHRASIEGPDSPIPGNLLRLSIGIESAADLIADLEQALPIS